MLLFDASTLILLAKTELLDNFLDDFKDKAFITKKVEDECCRKQQALDSLLIQKAIKDKRIAVKSLKNRGVYQKLRTDFSIGNGEAETLAFALTQKNVLIAIDDRRGIKACKLLKIPFATAIDIVVRLREKQILAKEQALAKLDALARHGRYSNEIINSARATLEVKKQ
jgi:predicted nucleic acid-binding protein